MILGIIFLLLFTFSLNIYLFGTSSFENVLALSASYLFGKYYPIFFFFFFLYFFFLSYILRFSAFLRLFFSLSISIIGFYLAFRYDRTVKYGAQIVFRPELLIYVALLMLFIYFIIKVRLRGLTKWNFFYLISILALLVALFFSSSFLKDVERDYIYYLYSAKIGIFSYFLIFIYSTFRFLSIYLLILAFIHAIYSIFNIKLPKKKVKRANVKKRDDNFDLDSIFEKESSSYSANSKIVKIAEEKALILEDILGEYGIEAKVINKEIGPSITRFELAVAKGTRVKKVSALSDDIAMNLEAKTVRIEAPIPGKNAIGVEIPNKIRKGVLFGSLIKRKSKKSHLEVILGKNIVGEDILVDLRKLPHLLVAGRTGAGKSVGINVMVSSILYSASPRDVKFIMIDPKMVELMPYNGIPHLYVPVITDPKLAANALNWAVEEMERRYKLLAANGVRHLDRYNTLTKDKIPYLVVIIDELADLMMVAPGSIETSIARIAQKARAVGIHLIIATQRPSIDVITGTIKANLPSRISFAVTSHIDSRTILDTQGAEKLLGRGDMLFFESGKPGLVRIQGAYLSDEEVNKFVSYLRSKEEPQYNYDIVREPEVDEKDVLYDKAIEAIKAEGKISTSFIQRKLKVGYSRAARILDQLEETGVIEINENGDKVLSEED